MTRKFEAEMQIHASPEAVWTALTSGEGIQSWFAPEARVTPGDGGSVWISWGPGMEGESRICAWEPGRRFAYTQDRGEGREPGVVEFLIEAKGGGTTLRVVQSGFGADASFEDEYDSTSRAWKQFFHLLVHGLEHPHTAARNVTVFRIIDRSRQELWEALAAETGARGVVTYDDGVGCRSIEYPELNRSVAAIFCEKCGGQTTLTIMSILYDQSDVVADRLTREWTGIADALATIPTSPAHP